MTSIAGDMGRDGLDAMEIIMAVRDMVTGPLKAIRSSLEEFGSFIMQFAEEKLSKVEQKFEGLGGVMSALGSKMSESARALNPGGLVHKAWDSFKDLIHALTGKVAKLVGVLTAALSIREIYKVGVKVENQLNRIANITGSMSYASGFRSWMKDMSLQLPVARDELAQFGESMNKLGYDARNMNIKAALGASFGEGTSFLDTTSTMQQIAMGQMNPDVLVQKFRAIPYEIVSALRATEPGMLGFQQRWKIMTDAMSHYYGDTIDRMQNSTQNLLKRILDTLRDFAEAVAGISTEGGAFGPMHNLIKDISNWMVKNRGTLIQVGHDISQVFIAVFRSIGSVMSTFAHDLNHLFGGTKDNFKDFEKNVIRPVTTFLVLAIQKVTELINRFDDWMLNGYIKNFFSGVANILDHIKDVVDWIDNKFELKSWKHVFSGLSQGVDLAAHKDDLEATVRDSSAPISARRAALSQLQYLVASAVRDQRAYDTGSLQLPEIASDPTKSAALRSRIHAADAQLKILSGGLASASGVMALADTMANQGSSTQVTIESLNVHTPMDSVVALISDSVSHAMKVASDSTNDPKAKQSFEAARRAAQTYRAPTSAPLSIIPKK